jgi:parvulin-like peptidyl-prolyl isomerase
MVHRTFFLFAFFSLYVASVHQLAAQTSQLTDVPLAKVKDRIITRKEFVSRYELAPMLERTIASQTSSNKMRFLISMIAEKLLVQEATERGLVADSLYQLSVSSVERSLVRDELYRREVSNKIRISDAEVAEAIRASQVDYKVYFLFAATKEGADFLEQQLRQGKQLEAMRISPDTTKQFEGPDSAIARWGEVDERMEKVIYRMKLGQTSEPIQLDDGYYIVKLMGKSVTILEGDQDRKDLRDRVEKILRKRKEEKRMFEYMSGALKMEKAQANAKIFREVTAVIASLQQDILPRDTVKQFILTASFADSIREKIKSVWDSVFVLFPHAHWTLGETIEKMSVSRFYVDNPTPIRIRKAFDQRLRDLIDQEHLTQRGYRNKLNLSEAVRRDLAVWRDYLLADRFRQVYRDTVSVSPADIKRLISFYHADEANGILVKFRHIVVDSLMTALEVTEKLRGGIPFTDLMYRYSNDDPSLGSIGKEEYLALSSIGPLKKIIDSLNIGESSDPFQTNCGYEIVYLLDRKYATLRGKDSLLLSDQVMRTAIRKGKLQAFLNQSLGKYANKYDVEIHEKNLDATEVTHIPAMVYRFLGFGGRMFAAPFLDIQLEWINNWERKDAVLP